jgi:hypothetical protein
MESPDPENVPCPVQGCGAEIGDPCRSGPDLPPFARGVYHTTRRVYARVADERTNHG